MSRNGRRERNESAILLNNHPHGFWSQIKFSRLHFDEHRRRILYSNTERHISIMYLITINKLHSLFFTLFTICTLSSSIHFSSMSASYWRTKKENGDIWFLMAVLFWNYKILATCTIVKIHLIRKAHVFYNKYIFFSVVLSYDFHYSSTTIVLMHYMRSIHSAVSPSYNLFPHKLALKTWRRHNSRDAT